MNKNYSTICKVVLAGCILSTGFLSTNVHAAEIKKFELKEDSVIYKDPNKFELDEKDIIYEKKEVKKQPQKKAPVKNAPEKKVPEKKVSEKKVSEKKAAPKVETKEAVKPKQDEQKARASAKKDAKRVYLSQSTQWDNLYYSKDVSEGEKMGELLKIVEKNLLEKKIEVFKNDTSMDFKQSLKFGNSLDGIDAYVALHSNAANHESRGPLAIRSDKQKDIGLAESIYEQLISIYPEKSLGRGIMVNNKYAETNGTKAPSTIIEVAFHDNIKDEKWIKENLDEIGKVIADGIENYLSK